MDKLMDSPWFLRFTALFLAIVLFFFVKAGEEKTAGKSIGDTMEDIRDVPVEVFYDTENLVVTGVPETVNMSIDGPANLVQSTKLRKDFTLRLDLSNLPIGRHSVEIKTENISDKLLVQLDPATVTVDIEEKITESFRVDPELNDRLLAEDYYIVDMKADPSVIEVTGAKSVIESISFVKATATADQGISKSFEQQARVRVLDKDLNKLNVTIVPEQVTVKVEVAQYQKEVPIVLRTAGTPREDVQIRGLSTNAKTITLTGSRKALDQIDEYTVDVDISKVDGQGQLDVPLKKPKGISKMSLDKLKVSVDATTTDQKQDQEEESDSSEQAESPPPAPEPVVTKEFNNIAVEVKGLDEKFKSSYQKPQNGSVSLSVTGEKSVVDQMASSDFNVYVDASGAEAEGELTLPVSVDGPEQVQWKLSEEKVTMKIELA
ncbi:CdaR family protein [Sporosarcina sp. FSL W7-1349]|uniref:CdaR family protein n=1 Tax=Sporosarcina sp. FSL W7-1349 TaxID=2921561 RepID=UPI0030FAFD75